MTDGHIHRQVDTVLKSPYQHDQVGLAPRLLTYVRNIYRVSLPRWTINYLLCISVLVFVNLWRLQMKSVNAARCVFVVCYLLVLIADRSL